MPPPYRVLLPTATSVTSRCTASPSSTIRIGVGRSRASSSQVATSYRRWPADPAALGPGRHRGVEAGVEHAGPPGAAVGAAEVDAPGPAAGDHRHGRRRVGRQAERAGQVVAAAGRHDAERHVGAGQRLHRAVHQAVAADRDHAGHPLAGRLRGQLGGLPPRPAGQHQHVQPGRGQRLPHRPGQPGRPAPAGPRVGQQRHRHRHPRTVLETGACGRRERDLRRRPTIARMFDSVVRTVVAPPCAADLDDGELVELIQAWERLASWAAAGQLAAVAELARRRPSGTGAGDPAVPEVSEFAVDEVAAALRLSRAGRRGPAAPRGRAGPAAGDLDRARRGGPATCRGPGRWSTRSPCSTRRWPPRWSGRCCPGRRADGRPAPVGADPGGAGRRPGRGRGPARAGARLPAGHPAAGAGRDGRAVGPAAGRRGGRRLPARRRAGPSLVRTRDGTCRFPGCRQPSRRCDLDHVTPWPAGPTTADNLAALCRHHHRLKHQSPWSVRAGPGGTLDWTSPSGHAYRTAPEP